MKIFNCRVYGLEQSLIRAGYPMQTTINEAMDEAIEQHGITEQMINRGIKLGNTPSGSGHSNFLKGIIVQMDITAPQYWWLQAQRYHWFDIISSQSKMHKILEMDLEWSCDKFTYAAIYDISQDFINDVKEDKSLPIEHVLSNLPMGLEYTAGISTNYLQLKTMYNQRRNHKLSQWQYFCNWCETLPYFRELCLGGTHESSST